ncbi:hypothetical protein ACQPYK_02070 [Streptosporangium sp. CA-135522]|uniref:hypothetical protein n=1 Tax=Streptosporangium sp. CA-135522 TaxID=3240072 RepID=UPI003D8C1361
MTDPDPGVLEGTLIRREHRRLAVLHQTYPGWHITHDALLNRWTAIRRAPLTQREQTAGVKYMITQLSPETLGSALADQVELAHTYRRTWP